MKNASKIKALLSHLGPIFVISCLVLCTYAWFTAPMINMTMGEYYDKYEKCDSENPTTITHMINDCISSEVKSERVKEWRNK